MQTIHYFSILIFTYLHLCPLVQAWHHSTSFPTKCFDFNDTRIGAKKYASQRTVMEIPAHITGTGQLNLTFYLADVNPDLANLTHANRHEDLCRLAKSNVIYIVFNLTNPHTSPPPAIQGRSSSKARSFTDEPPKSMYITREGYVFKDGHFYNPDGYCVLNLTDTKVVLKACEVDCSANLTTSYWYHPNIVNDTLYSKSRICIPKCCGMDETFSKSDLSCRKLNDTEPFYFIPYLYLPDPIKAYEEENDIVDHYELVRFNEISDARARWNNSAWFTSTDSLLEYLHFYRSPGIGLKCGAGQKLLVDEFKHDKIKSRKNRQSTNMPFRLEVAQPHVIPSHLTRSRRWVPFNGEFCVDGVDHWGNEGISQVVVMCVGEGENDFSSVDAVVINSNEIYLQEFSIRWVYTAMEIFSCLVLLLVVIMYASLKDKLTLQGCVVIGHCTSMLMSYVFSTIGQLAFLDSFQSSWNNAEKFVESEDDDKIISVICYVIGIITQFFQLSTYFWLTMMNSKAVELIPIPFLKRVAVSREEASANKLLAFKLLQIFAWAPPAIIVVGFLIVDILYKNPFWDGYAPDYAVESCFVATWSAGYYVHLPIGILLGLSLFGLVHRFMVSCHTSLQVDGNTKMVQLRAQENDEYFSPQLFRAVWCIQCTSWFILFLVWFEVYMKFNTLDWLITIFAFITLVGEPLALLFLYCMNDKILEKFTGRYPALLGIVKVLRKCRLVWQGDGLVGNCCKEEFGDGDTVVIEAAEEAFRMRAVRDK